jgi:hypothetical protein
MSEVGCYSMNLYCDYKNEAHAFGEFPHEYAGQNRQQCRRSARRDGWVFRWDTTVQCPKCASMRVVVLNPDA